MPAVFKVFSRVWPLVLAFAAVAIAYLLSAGSLLEQQQQFDRIHLAEFFEAGSYDNDLLLDTYYISHNTIQPQLVNVDLLGLKRDRLAYRARSGDEVVAIAVPASAEDGFNGTIDLLVSIDMYGRIGAAKVIEDLESNDLFGALETIESKWMEEFSGSTMREILGISWTTITPDREYDQFVGASITPKAVADRIYEAVVFFQSNRIELMQGTGLDL